MIKIYGKNICKEAIKCNRTIYKAYLTKTFMEHEQYFVLDLQKKNIKIEVVDKSKLDNLGVHQGIALDVDDYKYLSIEEVIDKTKKQYFLILDGIEDPHNLGAILRTADSTGLDGIIIPKNKSVSLNATVAKVSTGAIEHVNMIEVNNLSRTIEYLKQNGFWVVGADMDGEKDYTDIDVSTSLAIVIGSEGEGMKRLVKDSCDYIVSIPMVGHVNSLNASVSASLFMYEILRKKLQK